MRSLLTLLIGLLIFAGCTSGSTVTSPGTLASDDPVPIIEYVEVAVTNPDSLMDITENYDPKIDPAAFTTNITNQYFTLPIGRKVVYESETEDGLERIDILVPGWTRNVAGVETLVIWDRVYFDGELIEDTRDYLAQHKETGDVWYFGEHVDNYENGVLMDHEGAWLTGIDGAKAGISVLANPQVGNEFRNEYHQGEAEDISRVDAINETVTVPAGTYTGCVKTFDWSPLFESTANKYYCKQVGATALEVDHVGPDHPVEQRATLVEVDESGALGMAEVPSAYAGEGVVAPLGLN